VLVEEEHLVLVQEVADPIVLFPQFHHFLREHLRLILGVHPSNLLLAEDLLQSILYLPFFLLL